MDLHQLLFDRANELTCSMEATINQGLLGVYSASG
jgi:hypothetical protein